MAEQGTAAIPWGAYESRYAHVERVIHGKRGSGWRVVKHKSSGGRLIIATDVFKTRSEAEKHLLEEYESADARSKADGPALRKGWPGEEEARKAEKTAGIHFATGLAQAEMTFRPAPVAQQTGWSPGRSKYLCVETVVDSKGVSTFFVNYPHPSLSSIAYDAAAEVAVDEPLYEGSFADRSRADESVESYCKKKKIELSLLVRTGYPGRDASRAQEEAAQIQPRTGQWQAVSVRSKHPLVIHDQATGTRIAAAASAGTATATAKPSMKRTHSEMSASTPAGPSAAAGSSAESGGADSHAAGDAAAGEGGGATGPATKTPRTDKGEKAPSATGGNYHMSSDGLCYWYFPRPRGRPSNDLLARERELIRQIEAGELDPATVAAVKKPLKKGPGVLGAGALFSSFGGTGAEHADYRLEGSPAVDGLTLDPTLAGAGTASSSTSALTGLSAGEGSVAAALGQGGASTPALALLRAQAGTGVLSAPSLSSTASAVSSGAGTSSAASGTAAASLGPQIARVVQASKIQPGKLKFTMGEPIDANALLHAHIPGEEALVALAQDPTCSAIFQAGTFEGQKIGEELVVIRRAEALRSEFSKRSDTVSAAQMQQVVNGRQHALQKYLLAKVSGGGAGSAGSGGSGMLNGQAALMTQLLLQKQQQQATQQAILAAANQANAQLANALAAAAAGGSSTFASLGGLQGSLLGSLGSSQPVAAASSASTASSSGSMSQAATASLLAALPTATAALSTGLVLPSELQSTAEQAPAPSMDMQGVTMAQAAGVQQPSA